ncbi:hypothetical protein [Sphingobacterium sp. 1.A.4]|uniref:hypothetical protein n=1 Tax=Sphingobacterium sp. 1.A.4 TaxID=2044603 RepID=UPI001181AE58|nr:hypothetical protein [Sphingobacterium sp. 1.A.4]
MSSRVHCSEILSLGKALPDRLGPPEMGTIGSSTLTPMLHLGTMVPCPEILNWKELNRSGVVLPRYELTWK